MVVLPADVAASLSALRLAFSGNDMIGSSWCTVISELLNSSCALLPS